jgi:hypothetical protein
MIINQNLLLYLLLFQLFLLIGIQLESILVLNFLLFQFFQFNVCSFFAHEKLISQPSIFDVYEGGSDQLICYNTLVLFI